MLVDSERVLLELKRSIGEKSHHGQRDLLALIAGLEVRYQIDESLVERALRLYGQEFFESVVRQPSAPTTWPTSVPGRVPASDRSQERAPRATQHESEEDHHAGTGSSTERVAASAAACY